MKKFKWVDYDPKLHAELDTWHSKNPNIARFAGEELPSQLSKKNPWFGFGVINSKLKVAYVGENAVAYMLTCFFDSMLSGESKCLHLSHGATNPDFQGFGYGTRVLMDIIENAEEIIKRSVKFISLEVLEDNHAINKIAERLSFVKTGQSELGGERSNNYTISLDPSIRVETDAERHEETMKTIREIEGMIDRKEFKELASDAEF